MAALSLEILPRRVYVEHAALGQVLNFDLRFTNRGADEARVTSLVVEVLDDGGERVLRRVVDEHGLRPAIETVGDRDVPAGGSLLVFNPVHTFSADIALATVRCTCRVGDDVLEAEVTPVEYEQKTPLFLPLTGRVVVASGHDFLSPHRRIDPSHPFAAELGVSTNSGRYADDYALETNAIGAVVRAAGEGTVIAARGDVEDNSLGPDGVEFAPLPADPVGAIFGNHVVLDHGNSEFSVLGHLQFGSVDVEVGEQVEAKQPIGRLGLSGNTDFPHIHYQLQDGPDARTAEGLPFRFEGLAALEAGTTLDVE